MKTTPLIVKFSFNLRGIDITTDIDIPFKGNIEEVAHILLAKHHLPKYLENRLIDNLKEFITVKEDEYHENYFDNLVTEVGNDPAKLDDITKQCENLMREEVTEYGEKKCASDEELFATVYHKLIHSPALKTILSLEHNYSKFLSQRIEDRDRAIQNLSDVQLEEMNKAVDNLEHGMTESKINDLVSKHYEALSLIKAKYASELDTIRESQRREYRDWLMHMIDFNEDIGSISTPTSPLLPSMEFNVEVNAKTYENTDPILEESFTIHLGSQLKQMYNIRILTGNVENVCVGKDKNMSEPTPVYLQTALTLYSNDLSGLVLMTDGNVRSNENFQNICLKSTDFHFQRVDSQLEKINEIFVSNELKPGDFFVTKHSNLAQVHVIFHCVSDDSIRTSDINTRHPVVLGLRNILKTACFNDITSLTIPLLLQYDITEEMTTAWCEKRAELVFKCVKGFMIEMAGWGGSDLKNLQFMLPLGISPQVFQTLADMLPKIFKISNPKVLH